MRPPKSSASNSHIPRRKLKKKKKQARSIAVCKMYKIIATEHMKCISPCTKVTSFRWLHYLTPLFVILRSKLVTKAMQDNQHVMFIWALVAYVSIKMELQIQKERGRERERECDHHMVCVPIIRWPACCRHVVPMWQISQLATNRPFPYFFPLEC